LARGLNASGDTRRVGGHDDVDAVAEQPRPRLQRQRYAFDNDVRPDMVPALVADRIDPAGHPLAEPVIGLGGEEMPVALQHLFAGRDHFAGAEAGVDPQIAQ
jgi:hypothetical protein